MTPGYRNQVELLIRILSFVAKEPMFALHGRTAINLFLQNMPRLLVDIDLTYAPIEPREESLHNIQQGLARLRRLHPASAA